MSIPFLQAYFYTSGRRKKIRVFVIHDMEWREGPSTAADCAAMFHRPSSPRGSAHYNVDAYSIWQSVRDSDTAWGAPQVNGDGLHFEQAGFARQTRKEWLDAYGVLQLKLLAGLVAAKCKEYGIPPLHLSDNQLRNGARGIVGHVQCSRVYGGTHWDPGKYFPWDVFIDYVHSAYYSKPDPKPVLVNGDAMIYYGAARYWLVGEMGKQQISPVYLEEIIRQYKRAGYNIIHVSSKAIDSIPWVRPVLSKLDVSAVLGAALPSLGDISVAVKTALPSLVEIRAVVLEALKEADSAEEVTAAVRAGMPALEEISAAVRASMPPPFVLTDEQVLTVVQGLSEALTAGSSAEDLRGLLGILSLGA